MSPSVKTHANSKTTWKRKAVMDFGTNTFHLLIADVSSQGDFRKVLHRRITVKLGQGGIHEGYITPVAFKRGINAVATFRKYLDAYGLKTATAYGTAALRMASNGGEFTRQIKKDYGVTLSVIDGDREAAFICDGVRKAVDLQNRNALIMDIGGGSTEFILADACKVYWKRSYKLGSSFLLETFKPSDPIKPSEVRKMESYFDAQLQELMARCQKHPPVLLVGSAGSFETFASMIRFLHPEAGSHYRKKSHPIAIAHFRDLHHRLLGSTHAERMQLRGLLKMRADMIVPAAILLNFVLKKIKIKHMEMSSYSLKEGALLS